MSAPQPIPQIHPLAELHETAFQLGIIKQRNLILASDNLTQKDRIKALETEVETLQSQIEHLQAQLSEAEEVNYGNPT